MPLHQKNAGTVSFVRCDDAETFIFPSSLSTDRQRQRSPPRSRTALRSEKHQKLHPCALAPQFSAAGAAAGSSPHLPTVA